MKICKTNCPYCKKPLKITMDKDSETYKIEEFNTAFASTSAECFDSREDK
jgi:hypothetical protein